MAGSGRNAIEFKGESPVTFRNDGSVSSGTLVRDPRLDTMVGTGRQPIEFREETSVTFRDDGTVLQELVG